MGGFGAEEWKEHAALVGNVTLSWNRNVHQLLRVFGHLTGLETPLVEAIFFSPQSDSAQRRLIKRVAEAVNLETTHFDSLTGLLRRLEKASAVRNLAAHVIFGITAFDPETGAWGAKVVPALSPSQDARLKSDFVSQFSSVERELSAICGDLEYWLVHTPFPERSWSGPPFPKAAAAMLSVSLGQIDSTE